MSLCSIITAAVKGTRQRTLSDINSVSKGPANKKHTCSSLCHRLAGAVSFVFGKCLHSFHAGVLRLSWNTVCVRLSVACSDLFLASLWRICHLEVAFIGWLFFWLKIAADRLQKESNLQPEAPTTTKIFQFLFVIFKERYRLL